MKRDVIYFLRLISVDFFQIGIIRVLVRFILVYVFMLDVLQTYLFLQKRDLRFFVEYAPSYTLTFYLILCTFVVPLSSHALANTYSYLHLWEITLAGPETETWIKKEAKMLNSFFIAYFCLAGFTATLHVIPTPKDTEIFFPLLIYETYCPEWKNILTMTYRAAIPIITWLMLAPYTQLIYVLKHIKFQVRLFTHFLNRIDEGYQANNECLYKAQWQKQVKIRLLFCLQKHNNSHIELNKAFKRLELLMLLFTLAGTCLIISVCFFYISFAEIISDMSLRVATLSIATLVLGSYVIFVGQETEDLMSEILDILLQLNWYSWNEENKKIYLMFLLNAQKPLTIQFSENIALNNKLCLAIARIVFSVISLLTKIKSVTFKV